MTFWNSSSRLSTSEKRKSAVADDLPVLLFACRVVPVVKEATVLVGQPIAPKGDRRPASLLDPLAELQ
jgi:hypothetical protein